MGTTLNYKKLVILVAGICAVGPMGAFAEDAKISQIENSLSSAVYLKGESLKQYNILERMKDHAVPGVSMALIDQGKIQWTKSWGVKNLATDDPVTAESLFQAASISKPVAAFGAMLLVDKGEITLDAPINNYLKQWKVPDNEFTKAVPVTLRQLLSHTAGMTVHGFAGYGLDAPYPTILDVLNGQKPANSAAVVVDTLPRTIWRYSGGGYTVAQVAMEDVSGQSFENLMAESVFKPTGMTHSTYKQPLPEDRRAEAVTAYRAGFEPVKRHFHAYPEMAAAGLWTTPTDLAKLALSVSQSFNGEQGALLSPDLSKEFLTLEMGDWGLGFNLHQEEGKVIGFSHGGANEGFRAFLVMLTDGRGAAIMTNSDTGAVLYRELLSAISSVYNWPLFEPSEKEWTALNASTSAKFSGTYHLNMGEDVIEVLVRQDGKGISVEVPNILPSNQYFLSNDEEGQAHFFSLSGTKITFSELNSEAPSISLFGQKAIKKIP